MQIGKNDLSQRLPNEVQYYGVDPYSLHLDRMDGNGGWIASALDLSRCWCMSTEIMGVPDGLPAFPDGFADGDDACIRS